MSTSSTAQRFSHTSNVCRLLAREGSIFALEEKSSSNFDNIVRAANSGFPRAIVESAHGTISDAIARGETLSRRTAELKRMLDSKMRTPALLRRATH